MENIIGADNGVTDYLLVLLIYFLFFLYIKSPKPVIELNYRGNFFFLSATWFILMFTGNYTFHLLGLMSFLPWLNNFIHSAIWIGLCLTWLYYTTHERPMAEQFIFFAFTSFIVKMAEHMLLGSWSMDSYFGIQHPLAYLIAMSLVDGFYPIISKFLLQWMSKRNKFNVYVSNA